MKFGEKLKALREAAGMTQEGLATAAGVPVSTLRGYEQSQRIPVFGAIVKLAGALDAKLEEFASATDIHDDPPAKKRAKM